MNQQELKQQVAAYWNQASCGTEHTKHEKFSSEYFREIEEFRYRTEPEIFSFAQFTRFRGKKVLEVGVGAGTDFTQWVRAGAHAYGVDLTQEALSNVTHRLSLEGLSAARVCVADAQKLPYGDDTFDLVYSWGVIHHAPDTPACLREMIRVTKPGGTIKYMIYNRRSLFAFYRWLLAGLGKGRPWWSFSRVLYHHQESPGTKAYTFKEARAMIDSSKVEIKKMQAMVSAHDLLYYKSKPFQWLAYAAACFFGWHRAGWFMTIELQKK